MVRARFWTFLQVCRSNLPQWRPHSNVLQVDFAAVVSLNNPFATPGGGSLQVGPEPSHKQKVVSADEAKRHLQPRNPRACLWR